MSFRNDEFSATDSDNDDAFEEDMDALRRACILTGANPNDIQPSTTATNSDSYDSEDDDLELAGRIKRLYSVSADYDEPQPLDFINPGGSDGEYEDDIETLRKVERMFARYNDSHKNSTEEHSHSPKQVGPTNIASHKETCSTLCVDDTNMGEEFLDTADTSFNPETNPSDSIHSENLARTQIKGTVFTECARSFFDAIQKNRTCQKFLRSKLMQIEAKIEENKKLIERVRILKDFQITCRKRIGKALSQKRDARVQLISAAKARSSSKVNGKRLPAMFLGPLENPNVGSYRMVLKKYPLTLNRRKWSNAEDKNLAKGIAEQFQQRLYNMSLIRLG
jgi:myb proto-oncogene protein